MGQGLSSSSVSRAWVSRMEKGLQQARHQMDRQMREEVAKKQQQAAPGSFTDPHAVHHGFERGTGPNQNPRDTMQQSFLQQQQTREDKLTKDSPHEMPEELVKFLNEVGPLERRMDTELTSPRIRERVRNQQQDEGQQPSPSSSIDAKRKTHDMPMVQDLDEFVTRRTTNFSSSTADDDEEGEEGVAFLSDIQLHQLLCQKDVDKSSINSDNNGDQQEELLKLCKKYLENPVVLKDLDDDSYVGAPSERVEDLKFLKLEVVPDTRVKIVMQAIAEKTR